MTYPVPPPGEQDSATKGHNGPGQCPDSHPKRLVRSELFHRIISWQQRRVTAAATMLIVIIWLV